MPIPANAVRAYGSHEVTAVPSPSPSRLIVDLVNAAVRP